MWEKRMEHVESEMRDFSESYHGVMKKPIVYCLLHFSALDTILFNPQLFNPLNYVSYVNPFNSKSCLML